METNETPLYLKHLSKKEIIRICKLLVEKDGIRSIERITGHHRDTISRLLKDLAEHAEMVNNILLSEVKLSPIEVDELWSTIKKKQKRVKLEGSRTDEEGDAWIYTAIKRGSYLFLSHSAGKWTQQECRDMIDMMFYMIESPFPSNKLQIFSDGNDDYTYVLKEYYVVETCVGYGQLIKIKENGRVIRKERRIIFGSPSLEDINTTNIENFNDILREIIGRLVRRTKCFSKRKRMLSSAIALIQFHWNFMDPISKKDTPAMLEELTDHQWSWNEFFYCRIKYFK